MKKSRDSSPTAEADASAFAALGLTDEVVQAVADAGYSTPTPIQAEAIPIVPLEKAKEDFQRGYVLEILERNNGNRTQTARDLGVDPRTIFRYLEKEQSAVPSPASPASLDPEPH